MEHSHRAKTNMTNQLKKQLEFLQQDLIHEKTALSKAKSYLKYNLPGTKIMISRHESGVNKTKDDIERLKIRILKRERNGECYTIL
jgi:hypothetical protein